jgi:hypothetical protein
MIATVKGLNYGQLTRALREQGFTETVTERGRTFRHPSGALLPFPAVSDEEAVRGYHLVAARVTVNDYGIMDAHDFDLLLIRLSGAPLAITANGS